MAISKSELESMSLDHLWSLHEEISAILATRIEAEKRELEKRLAVLSRGVAYPPDAMSAQQGEKLRRKYPRVLPKYRNPKTGETWSGRGRTPAWLADKNKDRFLIE